MQEVAAMTRESVEASLSSAKGHLDVFQLRVHYEHLTWCEDHLNNLRIMLRLLSKTPFGTFSFPPATVELEPELYGGYEDTIDNFCKRLAKTLETLQEQPFDEGSKMSITDKAHHLAHHVPPFVRYWGRAYGLFCESDVERLHALGNKAADLAKAVQNFESRMRMMMGRLQQGVVGTSGRKGSKKRRSRRNEGL